MADPGPITDSYIDSIIKANGASNPDPTKTQGADLRELIKMLRDHFEAEISTTTTQIGLEIGARESGDMDLQSQIYLLVAPPNYRAPGESLSSTQTSSGLEVGQSINIPLSSAFNQLDGGPSTSVNLKKNGAVIASGTTDNPLNYTDSNILIGASAISYQSQRAYANGPILNNPTLNFPDPRGQILAGNISSNILSYTGNYAWYWGKSADGNTSLDVTTGSKVVSNAGGALVINFNASSQYLWFAHDASIATKTTWFVTALNNGAIGGSSNLFASPITITVAGLYTTRSYKLYMTNYATSVNTNMTLS